MVSYVTHVYKEQSTLCEDVLIQSVETARHDRFTLNTISSSVLFIQSQRHNGNSFTRVSRCLKFEKKTALVLDLLCHSLSILSWNQDWKSWIPTLSSPVSWWCDVHSLWAPLHQFGIFQTLKLALHVCVVFWSQAKSKRCTVERRGQSQSAGNLMILSTKYLEQMHRKQHDNA